MGSEFCTVALLRISNSITYLVISFLASWGFLQIYWGISSLNPQGPGLFSVIRDLGKGGSNLDPSKKNR